MGATPPIEKFQIGLLSTSFLFQFVDLAASRIDDLVFLFVANVEFIARMRLDFVCTFDLEALSPPKFGSRSATVR